MIASKQIINKYYTIDGLKSDVKGSIGDYFKSDDVENLDAFQKLLTGIKTILSLRPKANSDKIEKLFKESVQFAYTFATNHDFLEHKEFLEGNTDFTKCIPQELREEMGKVAHCED